jgi:hypothetical protein
LPRIIIAKKMIKEAAVVISAIPSQANAETISGASRDRTYTRDLTASPGSNRVSTPALRDSV